MSRLEQTCKHVKGRGGGGGKESRYGNELGLESVGICPSWQAVYTPTSSLGKGR